MWCFSAMTDYVKLKKVTADNWKAVVELELGAGQEDLVTSNLYSVAEAQFDPDVRRLCREACRRLPDVQRAENEGRGEGSLDLSIHDPVFRRAIDALVVPGLLIGHRVISQGDELALLHEEMASLSFSAIERRLASGAARRVARELMNSMGFAGLPILRSTFGAPIWPAGIVGSMAHDDRIAVAAVGLRRDLDAVGIDIEPATPLPPDMLELIATPRERRAIADNPLGAKLLFVIKEAVHKAAYPLDQEFLDFHDIEVDLAGRLATTRAGRTLALHWCVFSHVLVVATVQKTSMDHLPSS
jgi:4'-phosphopantetheinyl transferase EntD